MTPDIEKTRLFYSETEDDPREDYRNYAVQIAERFPTLCDFLKSIGADPARPLGLSPIEVANEICYRKCQYLVFGTCEDGFRASYGGTEIFKSAFHPVSDGAGRYFVLEFNVTLPKLPQCYPVDTGRKARQFAEARSNYVGDMLFGGLMELIPITVIVALAVLILTFCPLEGIRELPVIYQIMMIAVLVLITGILISLCVGAARTLRRNAKNKNRGRK